MRTTTFRHRLARLVLAALAAGGLLYLGGCGDDVQEGGVGASAALPTAFTNSATDTPDIGVGNVHWVGNPRW